MAKIILTGDRPTGKLHIGHYVGSLRNRVLLQNSGEYDEIYIMIADAQALTDNFDNPDKVRENILEVALDYLACGIDPSKTTIFIQSEISQLTELTFYYMNLVSVSRLQRNPTVKAEIKMRGFDASIPVGFQCYPISQAADITAFKATTVPAGEDQMPMIEQCKEIVHKFNSVYGETLTEPEIVLPSNKSCLRLPGIDGKAKMSKSLGNCIYLSDEEDVVKKKVMSMFTDPNHLRVEDPGQVEGNPVFIYLDAFCKDEYFEEFWPEYKNLDELKAHYQRGGLGDVKVKKFLNKVLQAELAPIRARRKEWEQKLPEVFEILKEGSRVAEAKAAETLKDVKAEAEYLDLLNRHIVDGIIAGMSSLDESEYSKIHKPIVALDRYLGEEIPVVAVDHKMGGRLAAEVLLRNGCKRILHFRSTAEKESLYHDRHAEFQKIMDEQGIETYCYDLDWRRLDIQYYHQVAEEVIEKKLKFDGVFGVDRLAIECMNGLIRQHKKIPEEVKIVSYDGTYITELVEPQISTIVQPIDRMAEESVKNLCELINGKKVKNKKSILIPEFRKGGTTV